MIGIIGWGCYIPRYRLTGEQFKAAWGSGGKGSRAVASYDEDALSMAAEAALESLFGHDPLEVDRLYFASCSAPYREHLNAALVAGVADLRDDIFTCDFSGSLRAGTSALRAAYDAVKADAAEHVMVTISDVRLALPGDAMEQELGDGAAALLVGRGSPVAVFKGFYSTSKIFLDYWRRSEDSFIQSGDPKFIGDKGIGIHVPEALNLLLESMDIAKEEISAVVYYSPNMRSRRGLNKALNFPPDKYLDDPPQARIGNTGTAQVFLELLAALSQARPGDRIVMLNYSSGADAILIEVTDEIEKFKTSLHDQIEKARPLKSYEKYLSFRGILPGEKLNVWTALPVLWREEKPNIRLLAKKCKVCGAIQYPPREICWQCSSHDQFETVKLNRRGKIYTFTHDYLPPNPDLPTTMVSADMQGGGRVYAQMTDIDKKEVKIGMDVELVFRKIHEGGGFNNYWWKFRPV